MTVAVAVAGNHVLNGVLDLVGGVVNAILHTVSTLRDFILGAVGSAGYVVTRVAQFITDVVCSIIGGCLGHGASFG